MSPSSAMCLDVAHHGHATLQIMGLDVRFNPYRVASDTAVCNTNLSIVLSQADDSDLVQILTSKWKLAKYGGCNVKKLCYVA